MTLRPFALALILPVLAGGCRANRLTSEYGDLEVVLVNAGQETLTRDALTVVPNAPMLGESSAGIQVRNVGSQVVTMQQVTLVSGSTAFSIELPASPSLAPTEEATLAVTFAPPQADGATTDDVLHEAVMQLTVSGMAPGDGTLKLSLSGHAVAGDCFVPAVIDFGDVTVGLGVPVELDLSNHGTVAQTAQVGVVAGADPAFFTTTSGPVALPAGSTERHAITFTPTAKRSYEATVTVQRGERCPQATVTLEGRGVDQSLSLQPSTLDFGYVPLGRSNDREFEVFNPTSVPLSLSNLVFSDPIFTLAPGAPTTLTSPGTTPLVVRCSPTALGKVTGTATLTLDTSPATVLKAALVCRGGGPQLELQPVGALTFDEFPLSPTPLIRVVSIKNVGTKVPGDPGSNLFLGVDGALPWVTVTPKNATTSADEFQVSLSHDYDPSVGLEATVGKNETKLEVRLKAASLGRKLAFITVYSNDTQHPAAELEIDANIIAAANCQLQVGPSSVNLGNLPPGGTTSTTVVLQNNGSTPCYVTGIDLSAGSDSAFSLPANAHHNLLVPAGGQSVIEVDAVADAATVSRRLATGTLHFTVDDASAPTHDVPLRVTVGDCIVVVPTAIEFGTRPLGCASQHQPVQVYNVCGTPVVVQQAVLRGTGSSQYTLPVNPLTHAISLAPSATPLELEVAYAPTALGAATAVLELSSVAGTSSTVTTVALDGAGATTAQQTDSFDQATTAQADVLFVIDDSCSMSDKQTSLATNFSSFISAGLTRTADFQLGVTTTDCTPTGPQGQLVSTSSNPKILTSGMSNLVSLFAQKANVGTAGSGWETPLEAAWLAVSAPLTTTDNAGFVRSTASLAVVIVSDAVDQSPQPISYYASRLLGAKGAGNQRLVSVSVIGPFADPTPAGCTIDSVPDVGGYDQVIAPSHGLKSDICSSNWAADLNTLGSSILGVLPSRFPLTSAPAPGSITVAVNGAPTTTGWTWDPVQNAVVFTTAPATGVHVDISYGPACF
jgi:hypothetical protein